jgi:threonine/homoserine/homoserine lactone efflux protein
MFCALLLPQFVSPGQGMAGQYLVLGSLLVGIGALFDGAYALAASSLKRRFSTTGASGWLSRIVLSSLFGMAAVRLVLNER